MTIMRTRPPTAHFEPYIRGVNPALSYATANVRLSKARKTKTFLYSDDLERAGSIDKSRFSTAFEPPNNHQKYGSTEASDALLPDDIEYLPHRIGGTCVVYDGCLEVFFVQNP